MPEPTLDRSRRVRIVTLLSAFAALLLAASIGWLVNGISLPSTIRRDELLERGADPNRHWRGGPSLDAVVPESETGSVVDTPH